MKTNIEKPENAVICSYDSGDVVAIVACQPGGDISEQVTDAIKEDEDYDKVVIVSKDLIINKYRPEHFSVCCQHDGVTFEKQYTIKIFHTY